MAKKTIILVRHGQYHKADEKNLERLTSLGRRQAKCAAKRLKEYKIDRIINSTMPRAQETAAIIKDHLRWRSESATCEELRECIPGFPEAQRAKLGPDKINSLELHKAQADRAYKKYFKIPRTNSVEVLVCHGNITRYLICRALGVDTLTWRILEINQCGISIVQLNSVGPDHIRVVSHNDVGHIPEKWRTFI